MGPTMLFLSFPFSAAQVEASLEIPGRTAAAAASGSCWTYLLSQECSVPLLSQVLCCLLCLTLTEEKN